MKVSASSDADTDIVSEALTSSKNSDVIVVSDDTEILVLLINHYSKDFHDIYFLSESARRSKENIGFSKISDFRTKIGEEASTALIFSHAWSGCDTTSATFGHGKISAMKLVAKSPDAYHEAAKFLQDNKSQNEIAESGSLIFRHLYGGKEVANLNDLRYKKYAHLLSKSTKSLRPESLPPTESAARYHSLRVYLQTQRWKHLSESHLNPLDWGWILEKGHLVPKMTDKAPGPDSLLKIVRCACNTSNCVTNCSCKKHGLPCVSACKHCLGVNCENVATVCEDEIHQE